MRRAVLVAVAVALAAVAVAVVLVVRHGSDISSVADLQRGDCVNGTPFLHGEQPAVADLTRADCDDPHDAEVLVVVDLDPTQAAAYRPVVPDEICLDALDGKADAAVSDSRLLVAGVADSARPGDVDIFTKSVQERGDEFAAVAERGKAAGAIHHQFGVGPDYVLVIDEWDSAEHFEAFFTAPDLQAFVAEVGGDPSVPPEITVATSIDSADRF